MTIIENQVKSIKVEVTERVVRFLKFEDKKQKDKVTGRGSRLMYDLHVTTRMKNGKVYHETFTAHEYRKEVRIIVPQTTFKDTRLSLRLDEFHAYAKRRWMFLANRVTNKIAKIFDPKEKK